MTRGEAATFVKHLLFEDAATTGIASTANLNTTLDVANRAVWHKAVGAQPSLFSSTGSDVTYPVATGYYSLSTLDPYIITRVDVKSSGSYYPLEPASPQEKASLDYPQVIPTGIVPVAYWIDGVYLRLLPSPSNDQTIRICSVPKLAAMTSDNDKLLGGVLAEFHELVCYEAVVTLAAKDEESNSFQAFTKIRNDLYRDFYRHLGKRNTYRPHSIREVPF